MRRLDSALRRALQLVVFPAVLVAPLSAQTQTPEEPATPRLHVGLAGAVAQPVGEFRDYVSVGGGLHGFLRVNLHESGLVSLKVHAAFLNYGNETRRVCLSETVGCRIQVDLTTSNNILLLGAGPEVGIPLGRTRLYANAALGLGYFSTDSQVTGTSQQEPFATTRNFGDGGLSWTAGGGLEVPVARARGMPVYLDLGVSHHGNGRREYLTRGGIVDLPDGSLEFDVKRSAADFLTWRIGASLGIGPLGDAR